MRDAEYAALYGGTVACTMRLSKSFGTPLFMTDKDRRRLRHKVFGIVKTAHAKFPKKYLEETMETWLAGSHLVLESTIDGVNCIAIGYKYNSRK
eukprot:scaffold2029_cov181-Amphora_coffeaeformis.AAC.1